MCSTEAVCNGCCTEIRACNQYCIPGRGGHQEDTSHADSGDMTLKEGEKNTNTCPRDSAKIHDEGICRLAQEMHYMDHKFIVIEEEYAQFYPSGCSRLDYNGLKEIQFNDIPIYQGHGGSHTYPICITMPACPAQASQWPGHECREGEDCCLKHTSGTYATSTPSEDLVYRLNPDADNCELSYPTLHYEERTSGKCTDKWGCQYIVYENECNAAAKSLLWPSVYDTYTDDDEIHGCFLQADEKTRLNVGRANDVECDSHLKCACKCYVQPPPCHDKKGSDCSKAHETDCEIWYVDILDESGQTEQHNCVWNSELGLCETSPYSCL